jgi:hypothetical protein
MRITIVGAILIIASVVAGVLLLLALNENQNEITNQQTGDIQADQLLQYGTDV